MKLSHFLFLSVILNAALVAVIVRGRAARTGNENAAHPVSSAQQVADAHAEPTLDPETWVSLQNEDLPTSRARLEAAGFPPNVVRALLGELIRMQFAPRRVALNLKANEAPFWMNGSRDPQLDVQLRQINQEQERAMRTLLGSDFAMDDGFATVLRRQLPQLSDDKIAALQRLQDEIGQKRSDYMSAQRNAVTGGITLGAEYAAKQVEFDREQHDKMATFLTPEEIEQFDLRLSTTANSLRAQLATFEATEQEFRALFQIHNELDPQIRTMIGQGTPAEIQQRMELQRQMDARIKSVLGDERFAEYQRGTDYTYRQASTLVSRLGLPPEAANQIYALQKETQQRIPALMSDRNLPPAARAEQAAALAAETEARLTGILGAKGLVAYKENGGQWLESVQRRIVPPPR